MSKAQGLSSPGAPSAPLSPVLNLSLGGALLQLSESNLAHFVDTVVFFGSSQSSRVSALSLPLHHHRTNRPREQPPMPLALHAITPKQRRSFWLKKDF
jgi:hypothetical protein